MVQSSTTPLAAEAISLIKKETKNEHRTLNIERRMEKNEKETLLEYSVCIIKINEQVWNTRTGSHIAWQLLKSGISPYSKQFLCSFLSFDVGR